MKYDENVATIYTIGHSTRTLEEFCALLKAHTIGLLVDIRSYPMSRRLPWFQGPQYPPFMTKEEAGKQEAMETTLPRAGIAYRWMPALGGRRKKLRDDSPHTALRAASFRNYADYMMTPEFQAAIAELVALAEQTSASGRHVAIMCAEAQVYWHCHRMLVSDYLTAHGHSVLHIASAAAPKAHKLTPEARLAEGNVIYDGGQMELSSG